MTATTITKIQSNALNLIRIIAMFLVINLHTLKAFVNRPDFFATKIWWVLEPIVTLSSPAVIIFFMLSGYLVLGGHQRSIADNWRKTWQRIIIPLLVFAIINSACLYFFNSGYTVGQDNFGSFISAEMSRWTSFPSSSLWFLVVLVFLYLLNPLWQLLFYSARARHDVARYTTALFLLLPLIAALVEFPAWCEKSVTN